MWPLLMVLLAQDYVGSEACAGCHKGIFDHWKKSAMGRSMSPAGEHLSKAAQPVRVVSEKLRREFTVETRDGQLWQTEAGEGFHNGHALSWAIGSGHNGLSFIVRRGDHLFQAPLSWYARVNKWELSPGYEFADYGFNRPIAAGCIHCHAGRPQTVAQSAGKFSEPPFRELAIGCENCHGPGSAHVAAKGDRKAIVNPKRLPRERADEICMNCHQGGDARVLQPGKTEADFRPGQPLNDTVAIFKLPRTKDTDLLEHHESMRLSACYRKSGTMNCQTCHNPHATKVDHRATCLSCHSGPLGEQHPPRTSDCVGCHMPKREVQVIAHSALTNHRIPRRPADLPPVAGGQELVHVNAGALPLVTQMQAYGQVAERGAFYLEKFQSLLKRAAVENPDDPLVLATLGRQALREKDYAKAEQLLSAARARGSVSPTTYEDLGEALGRMNRLEEAVAVLREGIAQAPFQPVLYKSLALRYIQMQRYPEAKATLEEYVERFPEDDFIRRLLKQVSGTR